MSVRYTTIEREAHAEQTINKSRFIAHVYPVKDREDAERIIKELREQYRDANHNAPAFILGDKQQIQWGSDDGEPGGTAGTPIVQMLQKEGLTNVLAVVTRYYGGINLGTGGLVRAYTGTTRMALEQAGRHEARDVHEITFFLDYSLLAKLQNMEKNMPFSIIETIFSEKIKITLAFSPEDGAIIMSALEDLNAGEIDILSESDRIL